MRRSLNNGRIVSSSSSGDSPSPKRVQVQDKPVPAPRSAIQVRKSPVPAPRSPIQAPKSPMPAPRKKVQVEFSSSSESDAELKTLINAVLEKSKKKTKSSAKKTTHKKKRVRQTPKESTAVKDTSVTDQVPENPIPAREPSTPIRSGSTGKIEENGEWFDGRPDGNCFYSCVMFSMVSLGICLYLFMFFDSALQNSIYGGSPQTETRNGFYT